MLGAGDAFASGFIYGYLKGWDIKKSCKMGNACGALVVLQPGCANFMPTLNQALKFINKHGVFKMNKIKLTVAQAIIKYINNQYIETDGIEKNFLRDVLVY